MWRANTFVVLARWPLGEDIALHELRDVDSQAGRSPALVLKAVIAHAHGLCAVPEPRETDFVLRAGGAHPLPAPAAVVLPGREQARRDHFEAPVAFVTARIVDPIVRLRDGAPRRHGGRRGRRAPVREQGRHAGKAASRAAVGGARRRDTLRQTKNAPHTLHSC